MDDQVQPLEGWLRVAFVGSVAVAGACLGVLIAAPPANPALLIAGTALGTGGAWGCTQLHTYRVLRRERQREREARDELVRLGAFANGLIELLVSSPHCVVTEGEVSELRTAQFGWLHQASDGTVLASLLATSERLLSATHPDGPLEPAEEEQRELLHGAVTASIAWSEIQERELLSRRPLHFSQPLRFGLGSD